MGRAIITKGKTGRMVRIGGMAIKRRTGNGVTRRRRRERERKGCGMRQRETRGGVSQITTQYWRWRRRSLRTMKSPLTID